MKTRTSTKLVLLLVGLTCGLIAAELSLRLIGFSFRTYRVVQFGWPEPQEIRDSYTPDRDLFWVTRDYAERLAWGRANRPAVIFSGDSCTEFSAYPKLTVERLAAAGEPEPPADS